MSFTRINSNVASIMGQRNLRLNADKVSRSIERLSSGFRINGGADDPSGLVLSELLRSQVGGVSQAQQNAEQGVNVVKTAEGALLEVASLLQQSRNLAVSAASDSTNNDASRTALQRQVTSAISTINKIANTTKYAGRALLDGGAGTDVLNRDTTHIARTNLGTTAGEGLADIQVTQAATKATVTGSNTYALTTTTVDNAGTMTINNVDINIAANDTVASTLVKINAKTGDTGVVASFSAGQGITLTQQGFGSDKIIDYSETADILNGAAAALVNGNDALATVTWGDTTTSSFGAGKGLVLQDAAGQTITLTTAGNAANTWNDAVNVTQGQLSFQIGVQANETAGIAVNSVKAADLGTTAALADVDISTVDGAKDALTVIDEAIAQISTTRSQLGAFLNNELQAQSRSLAVAQENLTASESSIRNTDFGAEMADFTSNQILVQSATAFLSQANSLPQMVLQLIKG
jgi:flagellin